jgi:dTDP-4-dehydrorhamnose 3,5-epimerase
VKIEALKVPGSWVCTAPVHRDDRGAFMEWFRGDLLAAATHRSFEIVQANHSVSKRGVVRGVHFADVPPGQAKYVYCPVGSVLDVVVDLREGSPTFGAVDSVVLDDVDKRGIFIAEGLGHAFCALRDDSSVSYLVSSLYNPTAERTVSPVDPELGLQWPAEVGPISASERDLAAPTLAEARALGILPSYERCLERYSALA